MNTKYIVFCVLVCAFIFTKVSCQQVELFNIDLKDYPVVRANFALLSNTGEYQFNINRDSVNLIEDDVNCEILFFRSPAEFEKPISVILVFDVSGSMQGKRLAIAQSAAQAFIDEVSLMTSEVAILSFNEDAILNTDFTHDYSKLMYAISTLTPGGGTSYNNSFLTGNIGIFDIAKNAKYSTHVVFLTDGLSKPNTDTIVELANQQNISVYCTSIGLSLPDELKEISKKTAGDYYSQINNKVVGKTIYKNLYREIQAANFGTIRWRANIGCHKNQSLTFKVKGQNYYGSYNIPENYIGKLNVFPDLVVFDSLDNPWPIKVGVENYKLSLTNIEYSKLANSAITNKRLPLTIQPGNFEWISIFPPENQTGVFHDILKVKAGNCDSVSLNVMGGLQPKVILHHPKGGEVFRLNSKIPVRWSGVSRYKNVDAFYRDEKSDWIPLGTHSNHSFLWNSKTDTGKYKIVLRPTSNFDLTEKIRIDKIKSPIRNVEISPNGKLILAYDISGNNYVFSTKNGKQVYSFFQVNSPVIFDKNSEHTLAFSNAGLAINNINEAKNTGISSEKTSRIVQAFVTEKGEQMYKPVRVSSEGFGSTEIYDPVYNRLKSLKLPLAKTELTIDNEANYIYSLSGEKQVKIYSVKEQNLVRDLKLPKKFTRIIFSPSGKNYVIITEQVIYAGNWKDSGSRFTIKNQRFEYFSPGGEFLVTRDTKGDFILWDIKNQRPVISYNRPLIFKLSPNDRYLFVFQNNQFIYHTLRRKGKNGDYLYNTTSRFIAELDEFQFSTDSKYFSVTSDGKVSFFKTNQASKKIATLSEKDLVIKKSWFTNSENEIVSLNEDNTISIWTPKVSTREAESGWFNIVHPELKVKSPVTFNKTAVGQSIEKVEKSFIINNNLFDVFIDSIRIIPGNEFKLIASDTAHFVSVGDSMNFEFRFTPLQKGYRKERVLVYANDTIYTSVIQGEGYNNLLLPITKYIDFGSLNINERKDTIVPLFYSKFDTLLVLSDFNKAGPDTLQFDNINKTESVQLNYKDTLWGHFSFTAQKAGRAMNRLFYKFDKVSQRFPVTLIGEGIGMENLVLYGKVYDQNKNELSAIVTCNDIEAKRRYWLDTISSSEFYVFNILPEREYGLFASVEGYFSSSEFINPKIYAVTTDSIRKDLYLNKLESGSIIRSGLIFFDVDKADLLPTSIKELNRLLQFIKENNNLNLEIHGHTDSDGSDSWNMDLSKRRANAVKNYLVENGINNQRLSIKAFGESKPVASNSTVEGKQQNRRVEIKIE